MTANGASEDGVAERPRGRTLVPTVIDERAKANHPRPYAKLPKSQSPSDGYTDISYAQLAAGFNACAHFLDAHLGKAQEFEPFAWLAAPSDLRYVLLVLACMKTGHKVFLPSPRNSMAAHLALLEQVKCEHAVVPEQDPMQVIETVLKERPMKRAALPNLDALLSYSGEPYHFNKTFDEARLDPCCVLHTSGSTGIPRAIDIKQQHFTCLDAMDMAYKHYTDCDIFMPFPLFHSAGIVHNITAVVFCNWTTILPPTGVPPTADLVDQVHLHAKPRLSFLQAAIIKDLIEEPSFYEHLRDVPCVAWGGSPLATEVGDALSRVTHPMNTIGLTESGPLPCELLEPKDWQYMKFNTCLSARFRQENEDQYEMVMVRSKEHELTQGIFTTYPDLEEWPTKDLYSKHPTKSDLWLYRGRLDDIIILSNGEKLNPVSIERHISSHPMVSSVLVIGQGRFQSSLLVEPANPIEDAKEQEHLVEAIWPSVAEINDDTVAHGRVAQDMIFFTKPDKPFSRSGKGTVQRQQSVELYKEETDALYSRHEGTEAKDASGLSIDTNMPQATKRSLRSMIADQMNSSTREMDDDADLFAAGLDSLQTTNLVRSVNGVHGAGCLTPKMVYNNPSISQLASAMTSASALNSPESPSRTDKMQAMFDTFATNLPLNGRPPQPLSPGEKAVVLLTGSTGSLGTYLLHSLLEGQPKVGQIICLNRSADAAKRQASSFDSRGLTTANLHQVMFHQCEMAKPYFGLDMGVYKGLLSRVTHVVHNAWPVNFNMSLDSFEPHVRGVRRLIDFSARAAKAPVIVYASSIATCHGIKSSTVPEDFQQDWSVSAPMGYAESKLISEALLARAGEVSEVASTVVRIGQIAGPVRSTQGEWNKSEWVPSTIMSSLSLGKLPCDLGKADDVDWLPVDELAEILVELLLASTHDNDGEPSPGDCGIQTSGRSTVAHAVNPTRTSWSRLAPTISANLTRSSGRDVEVVGFADWIAALRESESSSSNADTTNNPALKLVPFLESFLGKDNPLPVFETGRTSKMSARLGQLDPVHEQWMQRWLEQWDRSRQKND